jgi:hypothetical protein
MCVLTSNELSSSCLSLFSDLWDLGLCQTLLPIIGELVSSRHDKYVLKKFPA